MKNRNFYLAAVLVLSAVGIWFVWSHKSVQPIQQIATNSAVEANDSRTTNRSPQISQPPMIGETFSNFSKTEITNWVEEARKKIEAGQWEWKVPINFYGRVVDESNVAVADAAASFTWNDLSPTGTSRDSTTSDGNGFFRLENKTGKGLWVTVSKDGYYTPPSERIMSFEYAYPPGGAFKPDSGNPVIFRLRKKGVGVDLITSQYGMSPDFQIHIPRDGTPIEVDFMQRKTGDSGQMKITEIKPEFKGWKQATNWFFRVEIPDGGFVEENDEFPFEAPADGYQSVLEFNFQQGQPDWTTDIRKDYYIKFGNPPLYGRLQIKTGISYGGATLTYAINPSGSKNLESK